MTGYRQNEWLGAGRQQQAVIGGLGAIIGNHNAILAINFDHLFVDVQGDAIFAIPLQGVENDLFEGGLPGKHGREHNTVVVTVGLGTKDGNIIGVGADLEQLLQGTHTGHAISN